MTLSQMGIPVIEPTRTKLSPLEAVEQFKAFLASRGYEVPMNIVADGRIQRFNTGQKTKRDDAGWYVLYLDRYCYGVVGDWRSGDSASWYPDVKIKDDPDFQAYRALNAKRRDEEIRQENELVARQVQDLWAKLPYASPDHPYLVRKKVPNSPVIRQKDRDLVIPIMDEDGTLVSLEYIHEDGTKSFVYKGRTKGCWCYIPKESPLEPGDKLYLCEGYATAMSVHQATGAGVFVGFYCTNLAPCVKSIRKHLPDNEIIVIADNDENEAGLKGAEATGCRYLLIPEKGMDANDYATEFGVEALRDLLYREESRYRAKPIAEALAIPHPVRWVIRNWIPRESLVFLVAPSSSGKSFLAMDMVCHIAYCLPEWNGFIVHGGPVLYLCGEGYSSSLERFKAWHVRHQIEEGKTLFIFDESLDMDKPEGVAIVEAMIKEARIQPILICADTLNCYNGGNENDSQEARAFIKNMKKLQRKYGCTVMLITHTPLEDTSRIRGSTVWNASSDMTLLVSKTTNDGFSLKQIKNKPGRLMDNELEFEIVQVELPESWKNEDGMKSDSACIAPVEKAASMPKESDIKELEELLYCEDVQEDEKGVFITKKDWQSNINAGKETKNAGKNFFQNNRSRPYFRLLNAGMVKEENGRIYITCPEWLTAYRKIKRKSQ